MNAGILRLRRLDPEMSRQRSDRTVILILDRTDVHIENIRDLGVTQITAPDQQKNFPATRWDNFENVAHFDMERVRIDTRAPFVDAMRGRIRRHVPDEPKL